VENFFLGSKPGGDGGDGGDTPQKALINKGFALSMVSPPTLMSVATVATGC